MFVVLEITASLCSSPAGLTDAGCCPKLAVTWALSLGWGGLPFPQLCKLAF